MLNLPRPAGACILVLTAMVAARMAAPNRPNILVIWGDDIGQSNISAYTHGLVGRKTLETFLLVHMRAKRAFVRLRRCTGCLVAAFTATFI